MVTRNLSQLQRVTRTVAGQDPNLAETARVTFKKVTDATNASKIQKNISSAQLEIDSLTQDYRLGNESDPYGKQEGFDAERTAILSRFGADIPSMYSNAWNAEAQNLTNRSTTANNSWAFKQSQVNTVNNVNETIQTNLTGATSAGRIFGSSIGSDVGDVLNFQASRKRLSEFGNQHLGETKTSGLLKSYDSDYVKSFMGGLIETNPIKANELLKNKKVRETIGEGYGKLKSAALAKIDNLGKAKSQQEVLDVMGSENTLLRESINRNLSPVELEQVFSQNPTMSEGAKRYFKKINGFSDKKVKLSPSKKVKDREAYIRKLTAFTESDKEKTPDQFKRAQDSIYAAMDSGVLSNKEGISQIKNLIEPYAENISSNLKTFSDDYLQVDTSLGFGKLETYFQDNVRVGFEEGLLFGFNRKGDENEQLVDDFTNNTNTVKLFSYYYESLDRQASAKGTTIGGLSGVPTAEKQGLLDTAFDDAVRLYAKDMGLGDFDNLVDATQALNRDTQLKTVKRSQDVIDAAYAAPVAIKEVDDFLGEFGI